MEKNNSLAIKFVVFKIGHRGAMGTEPENTLRSFSKALELGVDMIELDVHLCKSGELVVVHDNKVDRTTNGKGYVSRKSLAELKILNAGKGEKIPTLPEVLDLIDGKVKINIELKGKETARLVAELIEKYVSIHNWQYENFLVSSFDHLELKKFHKLNPAVKIGILFKRAPLRLSSLIEKLNPWSIHPPLKIVNRKFVDAMHKKGKQVFVWTVNEKKDIGRMRALGVDGIFSDFPDRL